MAFKILLREYSKVVFNLLSVNLGPPALYEFDTGHKAISSIGGGRGGAGPTFLQMVFFYVRTPGIPNQKSQADADMPANIAFDLFNIFFYVIACKVRKCPLSPFVTSNVVLSCLVRMADILARLAQKADSLSALQLTGALCYSLSNTPTPPPSHIHPYP